MILEAAWGLREIKKPLAVCGDAPEMNKKLLLTLFFTQDTLEKWDIKTSKARELDKFFSRRVECTGKNQYGSIAAFLWKKTKELVFPPTCVYCRT